MRGAGKTGSREVAGREMNNKGIIININAAIN